MFKYIDKLGGLGIQTNEAVVYLSLLELGKGTVSQISYKAKINRTTGYDILERLCLYGLIDRYSVAGKKKVYSAEPPIRLRQYLESKKRIAEKRLEEFKNLLPELQSLYKTELKPTIKFAQGKKEMENMYNRALETKSEIYSILNCKNYAEIFGELGVDQLEERTKRKIKEKVLASKNQPTLKWYNQAYKNNKNRQKFTQYRWTNNNTDLDTDGEIVIFDDFVIGMLSRPNEGVAFEVQSQTYADLLRNIFELAWSKADNK